MRRWAILGVLGLVGCASSSAVPVGVPGGGSGYSLECAREAGCNEEAGSACPKGYDVVTPMDCHFDAMAWSTKSCSMVVKCRG